MHSNRLIILLACRNVHSARSACKQITKKQRRGEGVTWNRRLWVDKLARVYGGGRALIPGGAAAVSNGGEIDQRVRGHYSSLLSVFFPFSCYTSLFSLFLSLSTNDPLISFYLFFPNVKNKVPLYLLLPTVRLRSLSFLPTVSFVFFFFSSPPSVLTFLSLFFSSSSSKSLPPQFFFSVFNYSKHPALFCFLHCFFPFFPSVSASLF